MTKELELYSRFEALERRIAHMYLTLYEKFVENPELARFWADAALEEVQHASTLHFCREHNAFSPGHTTAEEAARIEDLIISTEAVVQRQDLTVHEAFYAALLVEASEIDEIYSQLTKGLAPNHLNVYNAIHKRFGLHHECFASAAARFVQDEAIVDAFKNLSKRHEH